MLKKYSLLLFYLILIQFNPSLFAQFTQDSTSQKLPSKDSISTEGGVYRENPIEEYNDPYYVVNRLNKSIGLPDNDINLQTPQAALEHFVISCRNKDFEAAAQVLNLNLYPDNITREDAAILAQKLYFVINQRIQIDWGALSDRADGQTDFSTSTNKAIAGKARRSIVFGEMNLDGRDAVLRLQRVKYKDFGAFWTIAPDTVENIDALYAIYGPRKLDRMMPNWARLKFWGMPIWKFVGMIILLGICYIIGKLSMILVRKLFMKSGQEWMRTIAKKLAKPAGIAIGVLVFYILLNELISFGGPFARWLYAILLVVVVSTIAFFIMRFINSFMVYVAENKIGDVSPEENSEARMKLTYISVARRVVTFIVIIFAASVILSQFRSLEKLGVSLLASAGLATVILGVAAQSTLGNIVAGIQIAVTRPARIGDVVIIDEDWGYVEDIRFTYMVVRTWDLRRLVIPLKRVISETFENWSMTSPNQVRPIELWADYKIDVSKLRSKFEELLKQSEKWDEEKEPTLQVVDMTDKAIKLRALCSAKNPQEAWDLHCELREALVQYITQLEDGNYLSKERIKLENNPKPAKNGSSEA
ncbi:mechanosensitive ion channel family protein [Flavimarina sp. Hel_I_48]|uniref:mechanosensitive ion channel family protein n=1 Tax=Flavimarina sp. Hel_I_48 TaxID=1392488 RepID=UPI00068C423D|nr:mechanosensitive ion channel domain-containing protein [Flavimarina sp. Hel_I_48]